MQSTPAAPASTVTIVPEATNKQSPLSDFLAPSDTFIHRHIGPSDVDVEVMLKTVGVESLDALIEQTVPKSIRLKRPLKIGKPRAEHELLVELKSIASKNKVFRSLIGQGYHDTITPPVILRNILENPGWYTQYTPYQAEISQGRLEALLNFQTMIADLTGLPTANASLLDEGTAAAEAMTMCRSQVSKPELDTFLIDDACHPQTIAVVQTRARSMGLKTRVVDLKAHGDAMGFESHLASAFGALVQYPTTDGGIRDYSSLSQKVHDAGGLLVCAADLLALTLLTPPGEFGADICIGSAQRFGVPMGFGGPHAAFMSCKTEFVRRMPGRLVGVSKDAHGNNAYRLTLQTREQHIRRERATSNICTAQVLLAIMAGMYAVYHGPDGLKRIAQRVHTLTKALAQAITMASAQAGRSIKVVNDAFFDTLTFETGDQTGAILDRALAKKINLRMLSPTSIALSLDELSTPNEVATLVMILTGEMCTANDVVAFADASDRYDLTSSVRKSDFLTHTVFNQHHSESEMLRYLWHLQGKDLSLVHSMIPLGSCTMKLNGTSEMIPVTWPEFGKLHPFAPSDQTKGYALIFKQLEKWLAEITGFDATWLQPNAGSQGEYAGLLMIREYHLSRGDATRTVCLIPESAHGTNPASAVIAGMSVVPVACLENGDIDLKDLEAKAEQHKDTLAAVMITYPSTHGVFEEGIKQACKIVHDHGGQVYMDGANMNAQVGLCRPGDIGADVCHLNLHKTFCIPHGGGGPGMGPICMKKHLGAFIPAVSSSEIRVASQQQDGNLETRNSKLETPLAVSAAPYGSPSILTIPWVYIALMGGEGLTKATKLAILNANYMAARLREHYPILFAGANGRCATSSSSIAATSKRRPA
ncbi:MAG: aminomethyl-transferring glycine dehydrogenase [Tepidisphaeraceae bacterium]